MNCNCSGNIIEHVFVLKGNLFFANIFRFFFSDSLIFFCSKFFKFKSQFSISFVQIFDSQLAPEGAASSTFYDFSGRPAFVPKILFWKTTATVPGTKKKNDFDFFFCVNLRFFLSDSQIFFCQISRFFFGAFPQLFLTGIAMRFLCVQCNARQAPQVAWCGGSTVAVPFAFW